MEPLGAWASGRAIRPLLQEVAGRAATAASDQVAQTASTPAPLELIWQRATLLLTSFGPNVAYTLILYTPALYPPAYSDTVSLLRVQSGVLAHEWSLAWDDFRLRCGPGLTSTPASSAREKIIRLRPRRAGATAEQPPARTPGLPNGTPSGVAPLAEKLASRRRRTVACQHLLLPVLPDVSGMHADSPARTAIASILEACAQMSWELDNCGATLPGASGYRTLLPLGYQRNLPLPDSRSFPRLHGLSASSSHCGNPNGSLQATSTATVRGASERFLYPGSVASIKTGGTLQASLSLPQLKKLPGGRHRAGDEWRERAHTHAERWPPGRRNPASRAFRPPLSNGPVESEGFVDVVALRALAEALGEQLAVGHRRSAQISRNVGPSGQ